MTTQAVANRFLKVRPKLLVQETFIMGLVQSSFDFFRGKCVLAALIADDHS